VQQVVLGEKRNLEVVLVQWKVKEQVLVIADLVGCRTTRKKGLLL
jgi:hypothetical protein